MIPDALIVALSGSVSNHWSRNDAEAYEEYGRLMVDMARFIKPILSVVPPDPGRINPFDWRPVAGLARRFSELPQRFSRRSCS